MVDSQEAGAHLVVACKRDRKTRAPRTWNLVTNLPQEQLRAASARYALRMVPKKHIGMKAGFLGSGFALHGLKRLERRLFAWRWPPVPQLLAVAIPAEFVRRHFHLSRISFALDMLRSLSRRCRQLIRQACASARLEPLWQGSGDS